MSSDLKNLARRTPQDDVASRTGRELQWTDWFCYVIQILGRGNDFGPPDKD
jgi:hypothetical protein